MTKKAAGPISVVVSENAGKLALGEFQTVEIGNWRVVGRLLPRQRDLYTSLTTEPYWNSLISLEDMNP